MADIRIPARRTPARAPAPTARADARAEARVEGRGARGERPPASPEPEHPRAQAAPLRESSDSAPEPPRAQAARDRVARDSALNLQSRRFLIVTAPFGPFGRILAEALEAGGARVWRMEFNAGDAAYWGRPGAVPWRGAVRDWPDALAGLVTRLGLTDLIVFGEGGSYNQAVLSQAEALKALAAQAGARAEGRGAREDDRAQATSDRVSSDSAPSNPAAQAARRREPSVSGWAQRPHPLNIWVLENGYFRPDWITVEPDGVNASSGLPRDRHAYEAVLPEIVPVRPVGRILPHHVLNISLYHLFELLGRPFYRGYAPPYTTPPWLQCLGHVRRYFGLMLASRTESEVRVIRARGPYFIACLQREGDAQLLRYSHYADNTAFLAEVLTSFAHHAPAEARLVVKNHPLDPGLMDLRRMTRILAVERGVADRVDFIDGGNLAQLCRASNGMVVNNSSAALSALGFGTPVKVLGQAFFDIDGLTDPAPLDAFWADPATPDPDLFTRFRAHVIARTQVNGNYHEPRSLTPTARAIARRFAQQD
ncbi:capsular biosynthesis protein [Brevundimonas sp. LM2]|nr:capsular biosynthesis protein [Brevundimonas sp. LM2]